MGAGKWRDECSEFLRDADVVVLPHNDPQSMSRTGDVTVPNDVTAMVDEIDQRWGGIDVLVHSVSTPFALTSFAELSWEHSAASWTVSCVLPS